MFPLFRTIVPVVFTSLQTIAPFGILFSPTAAASEPDTRATTQHRLLNPIDTPAFSGIATWMIDDLTIRTADGILPRIGAAAIEIMGQSKVPGGKVDAPAFVGELPGCRQLCFWVSPSTASNVASVGFQVLDAKGEWLMQTVPVDWTGWKRVDIDPTAGGMRPAYPQRNHDGKVDLPLRAIHLIWFAENAGQASLCVDGLSATIKSNADLDNITLSQPGNNVLEAGKPLDLHLIAENHRPTDERITARYTLQANSTYADPAMPDPVLGMDHALGATTTVSVDSAPNGDARICDGDEFSAFETPWGSYKEVVATIDLDQPRAVSAVRWQGGDANWIFKVDLSTSLDGITFEPVADAQNVNLHGKWGGPHAFPWPKPIQARHLRLRFHNGGEPINCLRLPASIMVYDGMANDHAAVPQVGPVVASGTVDTTVPARNFSELILRGTEKLGPGAYLLGLELSTPSRKETRWSHLFVLPTDTVPPENARRFGINGAVTAHASSMRRCGFGWVRFENAKWRMYMPQRDHAAFDGSVAPWHLNYNQIFAAYQQSGLRVLPYVFQPPDWASSAPMDVQRNREGYPPGNPADYGDAIFQLVARFGRAQVDPSLLKSADKKSGLAMIDAVELWNEPNLSDPGWGPFIGTMAQYFEVMRAGAEGSRRADPSLPVSAAGLAGIDLEIVGQLAEYRYADGKTPLDLVDIINVHFYSGREEPETAGWDPNVQRDGPSAGAPAYPEQLEELVAWRDQLKPKAEIWMTETGNDVGGPIGRSERHQAAKVPRAVILALAAGIDRVFIYRETGSDQAMHAGAGLLRNDGSIRPAWLTVATMIRQLQGFDGRALRLPSSDPNVWIFLWQKDNRRLITAWTLGNTRPLGIDLGKAHVCDSFGRMTSVTSTTDIPLSYVPIYINLIEPSPALTALVADAQTRAQERAAARQRLASTPMSLFDFGSAEHVGMLRGFGPPRRFTPVTQDRVWDEQLGYGFASPAAQNDDAHWVRDPLERDGCRLSPDNAFRFRLTPGTYTLRIRATPLQDQKPLAIRVQAAGQLQQKTISPDTPVAEFTVQGGNQPIEVSLKDWAILRWLSAIPQTPSRRP